jgi:hypothetical protein
MFLLKLSPYGEFIRVPKALASYRTQHRRSLEQRRVALYVEDDWRYLTELLPTLAGKGSSWIHHAATLRLPHLINLVSRLETSEQKPETIERLRVVGRIAGYEQQLEDWISDQSKPFIGPPLSLYDKIKATVRQRIFRCYQR